MLRQHKGSKTTTVFGTLPKAFAQPQQKLTKSANPADDPTSFGPF
jgi:hypothetical protein